jgi:flagellar biosynthesis protein FliR
MEALDGLLRSAQGQQVVLAFFLALARVSPLFILAPLFSNRQVPARARGVCAVALAIGLTPVAMADPAPLPGDAIALGGLIVKELLVGAAFAYAIAAVVAAAQAAGAVLDTLIGFSFGSLVDPLTGNQSSVLMQLYGLVLVAVFIAIQGDSWVIGGLARTYELVPMVEAPQLGSLVEGVQKAFVGVATSAVAVCAPVLLAIFVTDAAFGIVSRVMPQLNVFGVGFPAKVVVGLLLIGISLPFVVQWFSDEVQHAVTGVLRSLRAP